MKTTLILALSLMISSISQAVVHDGWERPVAHAKLAVESRHGLFSDVQTMDLVMNQQDGSGSPTSLTLSLNGVSTHFAIQAISHDGCGSQIYVAHSLNGGQEQLTLVDHSSRICMDFVPHMWKTRLVRTANNELVGEATAAGEPESVFTVTSAHKKLPFGL